MRGFPSSLTAKEGRESFTLQGLLPEPFHQARIKDLIDLLR